MQAITDALKAILKSHFQAGPDGYRGRVEIGPGVDIGTDATWSLFLGPHAPQTAPAGFGGDIGDFQVAVCPVSVKAGGVYTVAYSWAPTPGHGSGDYMATHVFLDPGQSAASTVYGPYLEAGPTGAGPHWWRGAPDPATDGPTTVTMLTDGYPFLKAWGSADNGGRGGTLTVTMTYVSGPKPNAAVSGAIRVSIDKSLQTDSDAFEVELDNTDGAKNLYPSGGTFIPSTRIKIFEWYGVPANEVQVFDGFVDKVHEHRDPMTTTITGRDWMKRLLVQEVLVTDPQNVGEAGVVRTTANYVYLDMEVSDIVTDLLDKANYPALQRDVQQTSYQVAEYLGKDGNSFADALSELADLVGYNSYADEVGVYHFEANARTQSRTDTDVDDVPVYTFRSGEDIIVLDPEQDDYDLKTRVRVVGPMSTTTLANAFKELWHTAAIKKPTGIWFDPSDSGNIRVSDGHTRKVYKVSQTTRKIVSATPALTTGYLGGLSGDPSDAASFWVLEIPWRTGSGTTAHVRKFAKATNAQVDSWALPNEHWTDIKVDGTNVWLSNFTDDKVHKYTTAGAFVASYTISYGGHSQVNPTGLFIDGSLLYMFFYNVNRALKATLAAPATITKAISTAGTKMMGGEADTVTHTEFWSCSDALGLVWKYTLVSPVSTTRTVYVEVVNDALEATLGEIRRLVVRMDAITSLAQAQETAQRWLSQLDHDRQALDVGIIGNPAIQKGDMVRIIDPVSGISSDWQVDTYRSDMGDTFLGTMSLVPWDPRYN